MSGLERRPPQTGRTYTTLRAYYPNEVPLWVLNDIKPRINDLTTRIFELRHEYGLTILNRTERGPDKTVKSFYLLVKDTAEAAAAFGFSSVLPGIPVPEIYQHPPTDKTRTKRDPALVTGPALRHSVTQLNTSPIRKACETDTKPSYPRHSSVSDNLFGVSLAPDRSYSE